MILSAGRHESELYGCHGPWTEHSSIGVVQLELIWREVKDTQFSEHD